MSDIEKVKDKIRKLLRLSESPNENESMLAMKKAQEMLIKYKLEMSEFQNKESEIIKYKTGITYTLYTDSWKGPLIASIAENYFCDTYSTCRHKTREAVIVGSKNDIDIILDVYSFAEKNIEQWFKTFKKENKTLSSKILKGSKNKYGCGYAEGVSELLKEQLKDFIYSCDDENAIVLQTPQEVIDIMNSLSFVKTKGTANFEGDEICYIQGQIDGFNADLKHKLTGDEEDE